MPAVAERLHAGHLASPLNRLGWERVEQDLPQVAPQDLGPPGRGVVGLVEQHRNSGVEHARRRAARVDDRLEFAGKAGRGQRQLAVVRVKNELLAAATDDVIARVMASVPSGGEPREAVRAVASGVFDAIDEHPWAGAQLSREPWQSAVLQVLEGFGGQLQALGVPARAQCDCASALLNYVLGLAGQYAAGARLIAPEMDRTTFLAGVAARWAQLDPARYPFLHQVAAQLPGHDDREQFLAGIDLILAGITAVR